MVVGLRGCVVSGVTQMETSVSNADTGECDEQSRWNELTRRTVGGGGG
jgi:hypothetical protein